MSRILLVMILLFIVPPAFAADAQPPADQPTAAAPTSTAKVPATKVSVEPKADIKATKDVKGDQVEEKPKVQAWWQGLVYDIVFNVVVPIFVPVLAALLFWLLRKFGINADLAKLDKIASDAAVYAEKKGAAWLREKGEKSGGAKKEEWAWELVEMVDSKLKAKEWTKNKLRGMILAKIPEAEEKVAKAEAVRPASNPPAEAEDSA